MKTTNIQHPSTIDWCQCTDLQRDVVASMGDTQTNGNVTLSYTVGQPIWSCWTVQ